MVRPRLLEAIGELLHRLGALRRKKNKSDRGRTDTGHHPEQILHCDVLLGQSSPLVLGWMQEFEVWMGWLGTATLWLMDSVRFGRALGIGTRLAAKTVASAIDAAKAPNPSSSVGRPPAAGARESSPAADTQVSSASQAETRTVPVTTKAVPVRVREVASKASQTRRGLKEGGRRFGEAVWGPFARLSGVLWLEFTGVFFGLFAVTAGVGAWKLWTGWHGTAAAHDPPGAFFVAAGMTAVFGYFCVSSFVRAAQRGRQR